MKKKILCLILVLMIIPSIFLLSGCEKGYKLSSLADDYKGIFNYSTIKLEENEVNFNYSEYPILASQVQSENGYRNLNNYNTLFKNMMMFTKKYLNEVASSPREIPQETRDRLEAELKELEESLYKIDINVQDLGSYLDLTKNPLNANAYTKLKTLFKSYNEAFIDAFNFNSTLIEIYFYGTEIQDYSTVADMSPVSAVVDVKLDARFIQQLVYETQMFVEKYVDNTSFVNVVADESLGNFGGKEVYYNQYLEKVANLNKTYTVQNIEAVSVNTTKKAIFKECVVKLNNLQQVINNDIDLYRKAFNDVNYIEQHLDSNASVETKHNLVFIEYMNTINGHYYEVLTDIITVLGV